MAKIVETPLMKQYLEMKRRHPDALLLFRVGDFYETFSEDAIASSEILGITLTRRANGAAQFVELAGFPHHALDTYLPKLIRAGRRVAICEQLEDPKLAKKLVKRGITEIITPGVAMNDNVLVNKQNNFLGAVHFGKRSTGLALLDLSTGEFLVAEGTDECVSRWIDSFQPKEILVERNRRDWLERLTNRLKTPITALDDWIFTSDAADERLRRQFATVSLKGFGVDDMESGIVAAGAILHYLDLTEHRNIAHISTMRRLDDRPYVRLDRFTMRNLEIIAPMTAEGKSLLDVLDRTVTPGGGRLMARWLSFPLTRPDRINKRLDAVEYFVGDPTITEAVVDALKPVGDLERLVAKVATCRINPRELAHLGNALKACDELKNMLSTVECNAVAEIASAINPLAELRDRITHELVADPPIALNKGAVIAPGVNVELDRLRSVAGDSKGIIEHIRSREIELTGIPSLKIGYNSVFGYYIEVTNTHRGKVPPEWIRKQTLVNAERYITPELKDLEQTILGAEERIAVIEAELYGQLVSAVAHYIEPLQQNARAISRLDCLVSFARDAVDYGYHRPVVDESLDIELVEARHPVIERQLPPGEPYISNSLKLSNEGQQIIMLTGPNMAGKSALLRQTALNVLMAQAGSFVPAEAARIGVVDKIFTRVGASDNISRGESTFMVEMTEAASILNNMSERSLIIFDELGRGTSTYDGISIAWAIVEHIHQQPSLHPKTLFATHYHELNEMERTYSRIVNYNVSVAEADGKVVFLRKLVKGGSEHSFGLHVARLAGMPASIVERGSEVLAELESAAKEQGPTKPADINLPGKSLVGAKQDSGMQLSFFQLDDPLLSQVRNTIVGLDINRMTPMEALNKLNEIKSLLTGRADA